MPGFYKRILADPDMLKVIGRLYGAIDLKTSTQSFRDNTDATQGVDWLVAASPGTTDLTGVEFPSALVVRYGI